MKILTNKTVSGYNDNSLLIEMSLRNVIEGDILFSMKIDETFLPLEKYPWYLINPNGIIYNTVTSKFRKNITIKNGYVTCMFRKDGKSILEYIHRLVALTFIPNPENKSDVNHINGIKSDNTQGNLEWCTKSENNQHSYDFLGRKGSKALTGRTGKLSPLSQLICQISPDGFLLEVYQGVREAGRNTNTPKSTILKCRKGLTKHAGGYIWL